MNKKIICSILSACTVLSMTACASANAGGAAGAPDKEKAASDISDSIVGGVTPGISDVTIAQPGEDFSFEGTYYSDRCHITFSKGTDKTVNVKIGWASRYNESLEWTMSGEYDSESYCIQYENCVKKNVIYKAENEVDKEETLYTDGTGTFLFSLSGDSVTWTDKKEDVAQGRIFALYKESDGNTATQFGTGDEEYYRGFSAMDKTSIEETADKIRKAYLAEDWDSLKGFVIYPVTINGATVENEETFIKYMKDKKVSSDSRKAMEEENCHDMFYNGQGLCMGSGQVWLLDPSYMTDETPVIKIKTIQGLE
ncbi:hypothetical protein B0O40_2352 [Ruminococcaceae bacterium R-25]|nr:hypothetical protein B0O40_2352 [Ruminococcaceae bacterium R-25]SUQ22203.1 hypothetical protein SAMN06297423_2352 [Oscillospiraceae bacterium]